jgi:dimethylargininase
MIRPTALVREPSSRLAEGLLTHIRRSPVDVDLARRQHRAYRAALAQAGWTLREVVAADECPDSAFVEDTVVICDRLAVLTRPGAAARRAETRGTEAAVRESGLEVVRIEEPATLDGGDVLQVGMTVYVGRSGRTNGEGIRQLRRQVAPRGRTVIPVPMSGVLHLKSAVTALPDGTFLGLPDHFDAGVFPSLRVVDEEAGAHVVPLGGDQVLIAESAPRTAALLDDLGFVPVVVDISEFEKLEGCVTCLSVLIPAVPQAP